MSIKTMTKTLVKIILCPILPVILVVGYWVTPALALTNDQTLIIEAWRIVNRSYVDASFNHQNWWAVRQRFLEKNVPDRPSAYRVIQQMLASLDDPFTRFLPPDQYHSLQVNTSGGLSGVGLQIAIDKESGDLIVIAPIEGSPAAKAGIQPKDHILKINDLSTANLTLDDAADRMRGPVGTPVTLTLAREDQVPVEVSLVRDHIALNPVVAQIHKELTESGSQTIPIGYIRLSQFNANATHEMNNAIHRLIEEGAMAFVLDVRGNPGGLLQAGIEIARLWIDQGPIVFTVNRQGIIDSLDATGTALTHAPLAVLVNQGTASASEILAGALQDRGRAQLIGEQTFGKGLIQSLFELSDGSGLAVTVAKYETPNHRDINRLGISPNQRVSLSPIQFNQLASKADTQYQSAVTWLTHQISSTSTVSPPMP